MHNREDVGHGTRKYLDADGLEELRVAQRQLHHLADNGHLLAAATNVVVANGIEGGLLVLALDGLTLAVDHRLGRNNAVVLRVCLNNLRQCMASVGLQSEIQINYR
jgi:hypothetical protein